MELRKVFYLVVMALGVGVATNAQAAVKSCIKGSKDHIPFEEHNVVCTESGEIMHFSATKGASERYCVNLGPDTRPVDAVFSVAVGRSTDNSGQAQIFSQSYEFYRDNDGNWLVDAVFTTHGVDRVSINGIIRKASTGSGSTIHPSCKFHR
jgi:hypothetical protein